MNHRFLGLAILVYVVFCQLYDLHRYPFRVVVAPSSQRWQLRSHGPTAYYSYFWVCTVSMLTAAMGLLMNSETLFGSGKDAHVSSLNSLCHIVSGTILAIPGHVCYQIDTLLYLAVGEFPLKLAMDVAVGRKEVGLRRTIRTFSCRCGAVEPSMVGWFVTLHHFWFLPVCFYVMLRGRMRVTKQHTLLACAMISVLRALTK